LTLAAPARVLSQQKAAKNLREALVEFVLSCFEGGTFDEVLWSVSGTAKTPWRSLPIFAPGS